MSKLKIEETCSMARLRSVETIIRNLCARLHARVVERETTHNNGKTYGCLIIVMEASRKRLKAVKMAIKRDERLTGVTKFL